MKKDNLLLALGGATGSGKTALAIALAKEHPELVILSADSRQVYRRLDIGSAKVGVPGLDASLTGASEPVWIVDGVSQFLIDCAEPNTHFTLAHYQQAAERLIRAAWLRGKVPMLVGGTGLYIQAMVEGYAPIAAPDPNLRQALEPLSLEVLQESLASIGGTIVSSDRDNKRRLVRAIERAMAGERDVRPQPLTPNVAVYVVDHPWEQQRELAPAMVQERLDLGLVDEVQALLANGINADWLKSTGLSYRLVIQMLDGEFSLAELPQRMIHAFRQLMRRQRTWFRRMPYARHATPDFIAAAITAELTK